MNRHEDKFDKNNIGHNNGSTFTMYSYLRTYAYVIGELHLCC